MLIASRLRDETAFCLYRITSEGKEVVDTKKLQVNKRIFRFFFSESSAYQMGNGINFIFIHDGCADSHSTRAFSHRDLFKITSIHFPVNIFLPVIGDINERWIKFKEGVNTFMYGFNALAFKRR